MKLYEVHIHIHTQHTQHTTHSPKLLLSLDPVSQFLLQLFPPLSLPVLSLSDDPLPLLEHPLLLCQLSLPHLPIPATHTHTHTHTQNGHTHREREWTHTQNGSEMCNLHTANRIQANNKSHTQNGRQEGNAHTHTLRQCTHSHRLKHTYTVFYTPTHTCSHAMMTTKNIS